VAEKDQALQKVLDPHLQLGLVPKPEAVLRPQGERPDPGGQGIPGVGGPSFQSLCFTEEKGQVQPDFLTPVGPFLEGVLQIPDQGFQLWVLRLPQDHEVQGPIQRVAPPLEGNLPFQVQKTLQGLWPAFRGSHLQGLAPVPQALTPEGLEVADPFLSESGKGEEEGEVKHGLQVRKIVRAAPGVVLGQFLL
jgi:hypothetical protein